MMEWEMADSVPHLTKHACQVWLADIRDLQPWHIQLLNPEEKERVQSFRKEQDRAHFIIGCVLSRFVLAAQLNMAPHEVPIDRTCPACRKAHGRPQLPDRSFQWSISHSGERVLVAFTAGTPVGVDVEWLDDSYALDIRQMANEVLAEEEKYHLFQASPQEQRRVFYTYWTRKEAILKATGKGLQISPLHVIVSAPHQTPRLLYLKGDPGCLNRAAMYPLEMDNGYVASLALLGEAGKQIERYDARMLLRKGFGWKDDYRKMEQ
ncbi:4'-phosphopantetheinyl transferase [Geobacillus sp. 47C-IIb]|nr:4'-phosphopantetheinyl transferase [Geobacillus thermodenitrificans]OQP10510.1 4'-phosphopantetheinyl transferase [Geobacillus sp. 47C-IIb]ATO39012.1 4'-phosphopantetheinyl transferase [Geobacillus thermodenitrificans]MED0664540.1 4'-phosphopantetheinyl transferase [Geobacillus thermodenitrificans]PJW19589.1 4'-phosphopantetheinyl transferase [Geobacillus thermodenitrificans]